MFSTTCTRGIHDFMTASHLAAIGRRRRHLGPPDVRPARRPIAQTAGLDPAGEGAHQAMFEALMEANPAFVGIFDLDGRFLYLSPAGRALVGMEPTRSLLDITVRDLLSEEVYTTVSGEESDSVMATGSWRGESSVRHLVTGEEIPVRVNSFLIRSSAGAPLCLATIREDLREQRRAERDRAVAEARFEEMLATVRLCAMQLAADGTITFANEFLAELTGWTSTELIGRNWFETMRAPGERTAALEWFRLITSRSIVADSQTTSHLVTRSGERRTIRWNSSALRDPDGAIVGVAAIGEDITEEGRLRAEQEALEERVRRSQKLDAVGQMAAAIAHDYNNVLTAITGYAELLSTDLDADDERQHSVNEIRLASDRASGLSRQLLAFARKQPTHPVVVEVGDVVDAIGPMVRRLLSASVSVITTADIGEHLVLADRGQLEQLIVNMAVNARDAMPDGGEFRMETSTVLLRPGDLDSGIDAGTAVGVREFVQLAISDTGSGMDEATRNQIFEPFFTTKPEGRGTGLGLATCKAIVRGLGGWIQVESSAGSGTRFRIFLPSASPDEAVGRALDGVAATAARGAGERILVVEDDLGVRTLTVEILRRHGYRVSAAESPAGAVARAMALPSGIDLLISDVVLPEMRGPDLAARIRETCRVGAVLFVSGYADLRTLGVARLAPGDAFLGKPFGPDILTHKVREVLDRVVLGAPAER
jgi:two-component system, cell cycle sensor histidine kinase and response regulator CckA